MKEIIHEDWLRNPTPREMWCWNETEKEKVQAKVIFVLSDNVCMYPVFSVIGIGDDNFYETYKHCAEIEEQRRMTNKELSRWLREKPTREFKVNFNILTSHGYTERSQDEEVSDDILIREDDGEWREPLVEVEE